MSTHMTDFASSGRKRRRWSTWLLGTLVGAALLVALWSWLMLSWSYSEGERAGILQKFSRKGWLCKTYEGELAQYVVGGVAPQIWHFSVRDPAIVTQLNETVGRSVRLHYAEHRALPTNCFGETSYFVNNVTVVEDLIR